jgi:hypothetical protein
MARAGRAEGGGGAAAGLAAFVLFGAITILWSWSVPLLSSPDEPHHIVKAAAVWRGEWLGQHAIGANEATMVDEVPGTYARAIGNFDCYRQRAFIAASCAPKLVASSQIMPAKTHVGRYPALYYLLVGWPSALSSSVSTMRWMRAISAIFNSGLVAFGIFLIRRFRMGAGVLVGYCCALTPVAVYMDSTVQPNGLEATLGLLLATAVVGLARHAHRTPESPQRPPRMLIGAAGAAASALVLVRGLSPLWLACIGLVALVLVPWHHWRAWLRLADVRMWTGLLVTCCVLALAWIVGAHALAIQPWPANLLVYKHASDWREIQLVIDREGWFAEQMVGALTKETRLPVPGFVAAFTALCLLVIVGVVRGSARERVALVVAVVATWLIPIVIAAPRIRQNGINWQGRYIMPFAAEIVLLAGMAAFKSERSPLPRVARDVAGALVVGSLALESVCFWAMLRRYAVTTRGPLDLLTVAHAAWSPAVLPIGVLAALVPLVSAAAAVLLVGLLTRCEQDRDRYESSSGAPPPGTAAAEAPLTAASI